MSSGTTKKTTTKKKKDTITPEQRERVLKGFGRAIVSELAFLIAQGFVLGLTFCMIIVLLVASEQVLVWKLLTGVTVFIVEAYLFNHQKERLLRLVWMFLGIDDTPWGERARRRDLKRSAKKQD